MDGTDSVSAIGTLSVRVRLFARYSEATGTELVELEVPEGSTVGDAVSELRKRVPNGNLLPERPLVALNLEHVHADRLLADGDELGLLPPLAGG